MRSPPRFFSHPSPLPQGLHSHNLLTGIFFPVSFLESRLNAITTAIKAMKHLEGKEDDGHLRLALDLETPNFYILIFTSPLQLESDKPST